ncbi:MAG: (Fe-S)-binding protein [Candidatus Baldrarchaeia archaeon]
MTSEGRLLFLGCMERQRYHELADATIKLLEKLGVEFERLKDETCCGGPLLMTGFLEDFKRVASDNSRRFTEAGIKEIITPCPMCAKTFRQDYKKYVEEWTINAIHLTELISDLLIRKKVKFSKEVPLRCWYHDPCHLGRHLQIYDAPRNILNQIPGLNVIEIEGYTREFAWCCGGPIRISFPALADKISNQICTRAKNAKADAIIVACPTCYHSISFAAFEHEIKVYDISQVVCAALGIMELGEE